MNYPFKSLANWYLFVVLLFIYLPFPLFTHFQFLFLSLSKPGSLSHSLFLSLSGSISRDLSASLSTSLFCLLLLLRLKGDREELAFLLTSVQIPLSQVCRYHKWYIEHLNNTNLSLRHSMQYIGTYKHKIALCLLQFFSTLLRITALWWIICPSLTRIMPTVSFGTYWFLQVVVCLVSCGDLAHPYMFVCFQPACSSHHARCEKEPFVQSMARSIQMWG